MRPRRLDGTTLEGGGQLVRLSVCLSALTGRPLLLENIRGNRGGGGGLKEQHLSCVKWLARASGAEVDGMALKSRKLLFVPVHRRDGWWDYSMIEKDGQQIPVRATSVQLATSGAVTLVLQAILPFLLFAGAEDKSGLNSAEDRLPELNSRMDRVELSSDRISGPDSILLTLSGGTNVSNSPSIDYLIHVLLPNLSLLGLPKIQVFSNRKNPKECLKRGWATGNSTMGNVSLLIPPLPRGSTLNGLVCPPRGDVVNFTITILAPQDVREHLKMHCIERLRSRFCQPLESSRDANSSPGIKVVTDEDSGHMKRMHLLIVAHTTSGFRLGSDCLFMQRIGQTLKQREASARNLVEIALKALGQEIEHGRCLDEWMEDQVVVFQALAKGRSSVERGVTNISNGNLIQRGESDIQDQPTKFVKENSSAKHASLHTRTVQWVANELLDVKFDGDGGCNGVGYVIGPGIPKS